MCPAWLHSGSALMYPAWLRLLALSVFPDSALMCPAGTRGVVVRDTGFCFLMRRIVGLSHGAFSRLEDHAVPVLKVVAGRLAGVVAISQSIERRLTRPMDAKVCALYRDDKAVAF